MSQSEWAAHIARKLLQDQLPMRWAHTMRVAEQARTLGPILGEDADLLEAAAWLHDIGYAPDIATTGFHPLDGARYLRDVEDADRVMCCLVAHHTCAIVEAAQRGLARELAAEFIRPRPDLDEALIYCDMTSSPTGSLITVDARLAEISSRYAPDHPVSRAISRARPALVDSVHVVQARIALAATRRLQLAAVAG
jgi:putative nucleotidyltransferase with HDIG domain